MTYKSMDYGSRSHPSHVFSPVDAAVAFATHPPRVILLDECVSPKAAPPLSGIFSACNGLERDDHGLKDPEVWARCREDGYRMLITFDKRDVNERDITRCVSGTVHGIMDAAICDLVQPDDLKRTSRVRDAFQALRTRLRTPDSELRQNLTNLPLLVQIATTGRKQEETQHDYVVRLCVDNMRLLLDDPVHRGGYKIHLAPGHTVVKPTYEKVLFERLFDWVLDTAAYTYESGSRPYREYCQSGARALDIVFADMSSEKQRIIALQKGNYQPPSRSRSAVRQGHSLACA